MCVWLQKERDKSRVVRDQEERLVVSAWYNLVSTISSPPPSPPTFYVLRFAIGLTDLMMTFSAVVFIYAWAKDSFVLLPSLALVVKELHLH